MEILRNISILILFFGIILLTIYLTKSYNKPIVLEEDNLDKKIETELDKHYSKLPSKRFSNMFENPSLWMGYADIDSKEYLNDKNQL